MREVLILSLNHAAQKAKRKYGQGVLGSNNRCDKASRRGEGDDQNYKRGEGTGNGSSPHGFFDSVDHSDCTIQNFEQRRARTLSDRCAQVPSHEELCARLCTVPCVPPCLSSSGNRP